MPELMIFKAGKYPQGDWPKERVEKMVSAYDPDKFYGAPVVIGHRSYGMDDDYQDAHGWVKSLRMDGAGKVFAEVEDISEKVREKVASKRLRYMSVEIYENDKVDAAQPPYLRAIALLGRDTPAVAGARLPAFFSLTAGGVVEAVSEEQHITTFTQKLSGDVIKAFSVMEGVTQSREVNMEELEKLKAEFAAQGERLAALQRENAGLLAAGKKAEAEGYFGKLRDEGRLTPAQFERAVALDMRLDEEGRKDFRETFAGAQPVVDLSGSHAAPKGKAPEPSAHSAGLTEKIRAYQKEHGIASFEDAAGAVYAANPALFETEGGGASRGGEG